MAISWNTDVLSLWNAHFCLRGLCQQIIFWISLFWAAYKPTKNHFQMNEVNIWLGNLGLKTNICPFLIHFMQSNASFIKNSIMHNDFIGKYLYSVELAKLDITSVVILLNILCSFLLGSLTHQTPLSVNKDHINVNFGLISKKIIFLKWKWKTGLNGPKKCPTFKKKIRTRTYCKFLLLPFDCEWQSGPENHGKRNVFTLQQEFCSQCRGQTQMNTLKITFCLELF